MTRQDPTRVPLFLLHNNVHKMIVSSLHRRIQRVLLRCELRLFSPRRGGAGPACCYGERMMARGGRGDHS